MSILAAPAHGLADSASSAGSLTRRLLESLDADYNVRDFRTVVEIIGVLENFEITKELLETTRLGKHVNELRRKTTDPNLAKRAKALVKRWRGLVMPTVAAGGRSGASERDGRRRSTASPDVAAFRTDRSRPEGSIPSRSATASPAPVRSGTVARTDDRYDSDSQDVIFVDDDAPVADDASSLGSDAFARYARGDRSRDEAVGSPGRALERRRGDSGKSKKRRSERPTGRGDDAPVGSASASPNSFSGAIGNGIVRNVPSPMDSISLLDDLDDDSSAPVVVVESKGRSRKNGCRKPTVDMEEYSAFIKNKLPSSGKKVKTTKELLEEIQARKAGKIVSPAKSGNVTPKEDFLTVYDSKKQIKAEAVITDIIELNDSNSLGDGEEKTDSSVKTIPKDGDVAATETPPKFESLEALLAKLPPFDRKNILVDDDFAPECSCTITYNENDDVVKEEESGNGDRIFDKDKCDNASADPIFEVNIDPDCCAARFYETRSSCEMDNRVFALHNCYIPDVNGTVDRREKIVQHPVCKADDWGHRPYFDCENNLFLNVVPKYNYMDYSSDRCLKNFSQIPLEKYECDFEDPEEWFKKMEWEHREKFNIPVTDDINPVQISEIPLKKELQSESSSEEKCFLFTNSENNNECEPMNIDSDIKDSDNILGTSSVSVNDLSSETFRRHSTVKRRKKVFTYEDDISLLPLSLTALNDSAPMKRDNNDLSCVFRTKRPAFISEYECSPSPADADLTYDVIDDPTIIEMKDLTDGAVERLRRGRRRSDSFLGQLNDNANCDSDIKKKDSCLKTNESAFDNVNICAKGGCPQWVLSNNKNFKEWHEPVVRFSLNDEPLTVLPYVIID